MSSRVSRRDIVRVVTIGLLDEPQQRTVWLRRLAAFLVTHGMVNQADLVVNDIAYELYLRAGVLTAEVASARELADDVRRSITELLRDATGAGTVVLHETTDQSLLGGFVARTPDAELDASVRSKLQKLTALA